MIKVLLGVFGLVIVALIAYLFFSGSVLQPATVVEEGDTIEEQATGELELEADAMGDVPSPDATEPMAEDTPAPVENDPQPVACPADVKQCPSGDFVSRTGPNCSFAPCPALIDMDLVAPELVACTMDAKQCPDGSFVGRVAPDCEFAACPSAQMQLQVNQ
jgi:hypothetical protein